VSDINSADFFGKPIFGTFLGSQVSPTKLPEVQMQFIKVAKGWFTENLPLL
jgi:hypothetical protein